MAARGEQPRHPLQAGAAAKGSGPERRRESLTGVFFHPQGLGKAAVLSVSKPSNLIEKRQIFSYVSPSLAYFGLPDLCAQWCFLFHCYYGALWVIFLLLPVLALVFVLLPAALSPKVFPSPRGVNAI